MPWLDAARYADTHGYHIDNLRSMWPWRDWVISAFNRNMPFDEFAIEQLAGDLLPGATRDQKMASGFNRNHMINFEGGAIADEYQVEYVIDRVEATSSAFMGLTMGCARCHSHKFDPITHKEFYQFFAFFNNVPEHGLDGRTGNAQPVLQLPSPDQQARLEALTAAIRTRQAALDDQVVAPLQAAWEATLPERAAAPAAGLVAHYELDGSFSDISGRYQHGRTVSGDPTFDPGQLGRAVSFDGDTEVSFGNVADFDRTDPFSIAVWLKGRGNLPMGVLQKLDDGEHRRGFEWRLRGCGARRDPALGGAADGHARRRSGAAAAGADRASGSGSATGTTSPSTYDGSGRSSGLRLFVNGKLAETEVVHDTLAGPIRTAAPLCVGDKALGAPFSRTARRPPRLQPDADDGGSRAAGDPLCRPGHRLGRASASARRTKRSRRATTS